MLMTGSYPEGTAHCQHKRLWDMHWPPPRTPQQPLCTGPAATAQTQVCWTT